MDAIVAPHAYGAAIDVAALERIGIPWVEDCATSPGTVAAGRPAGSHGTLAAFSFGATKYVTGGTGGMVLTDDPALATRIAAVLDETPQRASWRHTPAAVQGGRMADVNASIALTQLGRLDAFVARRQAIASHYLNVLAEFAPAPFSGNHSYYRAILRMDGIAADVAAELQRVGVDARTSVNPWLDQVHGEGTGPFPSATLWRNSLLSLPIHPRLTDNEVDFVAQSVRDAMAVARRAAPR
jgi:UDP-4-amino-4-deoxy-L-arabinose-oxoglutarate aminotransferase